MEALELIMEESIQMDQRGVGVTTLVGKLETTPQMFYPRRFQLLETILLSNFKQAQI